jgi:peptide deformylase
MKTKIVKNKNFLKVPTEKVDSVEEGEKIGKELLEVLEDVGGVGLAANQVGIKKRVCVVDCLEDAEPKILVNPEIIETSDEMLGYLEECLSIPKKRVKTARYKTITVKCDNWANEITFGPHEDETTKENYWTDRGLLECVCVQHEIGHLDGKLMTDSDVRIIDEPLRVKKYGRNEKVMVEKGTETQFIKYKKALPLLEQGWQII